MPKPNAFGRARSKVADARAQGQLDAVIRLTDADYEEWGDVLYDKKTRRTIAKRKTRKRTPRVKQDPNNPQPIQRRGGARGGVQSAEELRKPPTQTLKNGAVLRIGGTNKGGKGATPVELRQRCRTELDCDEIFRVPREVIRDRYAKPNEKLRAWECLAKFGGLATVALTDTEGNSIELPPFVVQLLDKQADEAKV